MTDVGTTVPLKRRLTVIIPQEAEALDDSKPPLDEEIIRDLVLLLRFHTDDSEDDYLHHPNSNGKRQRHPECQGRIGFKKRPRKETPLILGT